ncbi:MAG TPA: adenylate/guanylate cyclase domain-containing protein [Conexivisphaerales archaeon]|nr:adenylate/guanylate cyclase domain-containing protein [Conexivisphaerales archaeon]
MSKQTKRTKTDIYASILEVVRRYDGGARVTRISYGVGVPLDRLKEMIESLTSYGLLRRLEEQGETRYMATTRGLEFLETYWKMNAYLETFEEAPTRGLAAVMFTDLAGYTASMQRNEQHALKLLEGHQALVRSLLQRYHGREVKTIGDAFMVEFASALEACNCGLEILGKTHDRNLSAREEDVVEVRLGIHVGDVERKGSDLFGDAVNIAHRIQEAAEPGQACISRQVFDQVWNKLDAHISELGQRKAKNIDMPLELFSIDVPWRSRSEENPGPYASER